ncbi:MAG: LysE family translocator [Gammaproteobacteria bacterium]|jgi:threonine/homoserine/homoserine lactone efflux protein|nr:LysE family translocator [Gammaproteobacteria bacterium]NCW74324.1 LysE family translocator [Gammaproteobacteria bacterium]NCX49259.1 LysE family translocator [Gammaproteobacteria bacterium]
MGISFDVYQVFLVTAFIVVASPGPDTIIVLSRTVATGGAAGFMTLLGTQTGNVIHALLAGLGVSTLVLMFPWAFTALKYIGAGYLIYLAVMLWRSPSKIELDRTMSSNAKSWIKYYYQGLVNNLVNPKMIPFFIVLFPQFIDPKMGNLALQSLILGLTLALIAIVLLGLVVVFVANVRAAASDNFWFVRYANKFASITFFGLALRLATQED